MKRYQPINRHDLYERDAQDYVVASDRKVTWGEPNRAEVIDDVCRWLSHVRSKLANRVLGKMLITKGTGSAVPYKSRTDEGFSP